MNIYVKFVNPFINATLNVFETMALTKAEAGKPCLKNEKIASRDVSGVIGLTGEVMGTISVSFTEESILAIVSNMLGEEIRELNDDTDDSVARLRT